MYRGKRRPKSVAELARIAELGEKATYNAALALYKDDLVEQDRVAGEIRYSKDPFIDRYKEQILRAAGQPIRVAAIRRSAAAVQYVTIKLREVSGVAKQLHIEDIDTFKEVKDELPPTTYERVAESAFKRGLQRLVGEIGTFPDWGGEKGDLFTTQVRVKGRRIAMAIAFKGPGTTGPLTPAKMGKNGDQIQSLFETPAQLFMVQYWAQIRPSILSTMSAFASMRARITGDQMYFGVIDGADSVRLMRAYPKAFSPQSRGVRASGPVVIGA